MTFVYKKIQLPTKLLVILICLFQTSLPVYAQSGQPVRGLFWKASSSKNTVYLLGSIHLGTKQMYPLPKQIEDAFKQSSVLVVEVDLNKFGSAERTKIQNTVLSKGLYQAGDTLWQHVGPATTEKIKSFCSANGLPANQFAKQKPWLAALAVAIIPLQKAGMQADLGIDKYFLEKAKDTKRVEQLESAEWQIQLLSDIPSEEQEKYLAVTLDQAAAFKDTDKILQNAWIQGNAEQLDTIVTRMSSGSGEVSRKLREDRNPHMAAVAAKYLEGNQRCFMVVGAAHLIGKEGVVALLKKKGYKVEQVTSAK